MANTRNILEKLTGKLDESMGVRTEGRRVQLSPVANPKDVGRKSLRSYGTLAIASVIPDPTQPRKAFDEEDIQLLADSLSERQINPIQVRWSAEYEQWVIISGERRYRAALKAQLPSIKCEFVEEALTDSEILQQQLVENLLREELRPIEEANAFDQLKDISNWNNKQLASNLKISESRVTRSLALLKLPKDIQGLVEGGKLSARAAYELSKLDSESKIRHALTQTGETAVRLSVAKATSQVRQKSGKATAKNIKLTFRSEAGCRVTVSVPRNGGRYEVVEQALREALEDVETRIENNVQL